jgi:hypothetical protein
MRVAAPSPSIELRRPRQKAAQLPTVERCNQTLQLGRIEARLDLDAKTVSEQNPKLSIPLHASCMLGPHTRSTILNDLDGNNLLARSRSRNAPAPRIQRMHAQPMRRAKLLTPQSALLELRN